MDVGIPELLIVLAIIIVLFGPSRLSGLGKSLGQGIREFRRGVRDEDQPTRQPSLDGVAPADEPVKP